MRSPSGVRENRRRTTQAAGLAGRKMLALTNAVLVPGNAGYTGCLAKGASTQSITILHQYTKHFALDAMAGAALV